MTNFALINTIQQPFLQEGREQIRTWMEVEVYQRIKEVQKAWSKTWAKTWEKSGSKEVAKERIQRFKWIVISVSWKTPLEKTITVRRKVWAFGVEKVFPIHSSNIEKIEILRQFKVKRKSIKFIRDLTGKAARLKEVR